MLICCPDEVQLFAGYDVMQAHTPKKFLATW